MSYRIPLSFLALGLLVGSPVLGEVHPDPGHEIPHSPADDHEPEEAQSADNVLPWAYFRALVDEEDVMVIDVREDFLGSDLPTGLETARPIPLEVFLANFVARQANRDMTLLIFDETGRAIPRLQQALEKNGYREFYFLSGGIERAPRPGGPRS